MQERHGFHRNGPTGDDSPPRRVALPPTLIVRGSGE
jgi:hypothetical protein